MAELTVRCVLRIIAVVTVLVGLTWATSIVLMLANANRITQGAMDGNMAVMALIVPGVVLCEGVLLWLISTSLARRIVE